jgi:hypothetical protein
MTNIDPSTWTDAELLGDLTRRYSPTKIPPCHICGGPLSLMACGGGYPTEWYCDYQERGPDGTLRMKAGRTMLDEHFNLSHLIDCRPGGDAAVIAMVERFRGLTEPATATACEERPVLRKEEDTHVASRSALLAFARALLAAGDLDVEALAARLGGTLETRRKRAFDALAELAALGEAERVVVYRRREERPVRAQEET